jgi:transcriptional regulator with XRE-family HTH domain
VPVARARRPPISGYRREVGARIRELRRAREVSQEQLALDTGISRRYMSGIERGEANPSLDQLVRLARALVAQPAELLPPLRE